MSSIRVGDSIFSSAIAEAALFRIVSRGTVSPPRNESGPSKSIDVICIVRPNGENEPYVRFRRALSVLLPSRILSHVNRVLSGFEERVNPECGLTL